LGGERSIAITPLKSDHVTREPSRGVAGAELPRYDGDAATRKAFGETLAALAPTVGDLVVLDGEVANSTHTEDFQKAAPDRFFEMYIGEQNMLGVAVGLQALGKMPFAATFAAFLSLAYDFVRMGAISRATLCLCGS